MSNLLLRVFNMSEEVTEINAETSELEQLKQLNKILESRNQQLTQEINKLNNILQEHKRRLIPPWLYEDYILSKKIIITQDPSTACVNIYYPVKLQIKYLMYSKHDKPMKLPKVYNYPKLYIKFAFYDDGLRNCSLATTKFKPYRSAHSSSLALCATYNSRIKSLEDFERAIKFISDSFDTLNLTSMYDERWHKSFKKLVAQINNDVKSLVPKEYICQRCGNLLAYGVCITKYIRDAAILPGCYGYR